MDSVFFMSDIQFGELFLFFMFIVCNKPELYIGFYSGWKPERSRTNIGFYSGWKPEREPELI